MWPRFPRQPCFPSACEPIRIGPGLRGHLAVWAGEFARLAVPGPPPNPTWPKPRPADPFAVTTEHLYASAVDRYTERAFRIRVSLAASVAMSDDAAAIACQHNFSAAARCRLHRRCPGDRAAAHAAARADRVAQHHRAQR